MCIPHGCKIEMYLKIPMGCLFVSFKNTAKRKISFLKTLVHYYVFQRNMFKLSSCWYKSFIIQYEVALN